MISFQLYYIVNVVQFLIRNMNLMLKFTTYPQFVVDKFVINCYSVCLKWCFSSIFSLSLLFLNIPVIHIVDYYLN